ncbi:MAG: glycosyltransferase family 2 protein [Nitrospirae bacterium]|nr:glycosyltransferase family 2 protein [Nitrospirota bacterium]
MQSSKEVIIIIPAYNEENNITPLIKEIQDKVSGAAILVIDDGSRDRTARVAEKAGAMVIRLPFNMGYGAALQTGFKYALLKRYMYVVQMDADGQHDPDSIRDLLDEVKKENADVVIGSRFLEGSGEYKTSGVRRIGMALFSKIAGVIIGQPVTDPTSGYQALNRDAIRFYASPYYPADYPDADVMIMLHRAGLRIREIPVRMHPRKQGQSMHSGLKPVYYIFKMFLSMFVTLLRNDKFDRRVLKKGEGSHAIPTKDIRD